MGIVNTTNGPVEIDDRTPGRHINTTQILEEPDLVYEDDPPEITHVLPGGDWCALVDGVAQPLVAWVVLDDGTMYGVAVNDEGRVDANDNVEDLDGFIRYEKQPKEEAS